MAIKFYNSGTLDTPIQANTPVDRFSLSMFIRHGEVTDATKSHDVINRWGVCGVAATGRNISRQSLRYSAGVYAPGGTLNSIKPNLLAGAVHHLVIVYDKDDVDRRFVAYNGVKFPLVGAGSGAITPPGWHAVRIGTTTANMGPEFAVQDLLIVDGHALTDEEIEAIGADPSVSATIGPEAARCFYPMDGEVGTAPKKGDPGITIPGQPTRSFNAPAWQNDPTSSILYVPRMTYSPAASIDQAYVRSTGRSICLSMKSPVTGGDVRLEPNGLAAAPTLRINGGDPIALSTPDTGLAYANPDTSALWFVIPGGTRIEPGDVATISAPAGWAATEAGHLPPLVDLPLDVRVGRPSALHEGPDADPLRVGMNIPLPAGSYWCRQRASKNLARYIALDPAKTRPDGTVSAPGNYIFLAMNANATDVVGPPVPLGLYPVGYDDTSAAGNVEIRVGSNTHKLTTVERTAYRNDVVLGPGRIRKVRVFEVMPTYHAGTLGSAIDAAATTVPVLGQTYPVATGSSIPYEYYLSIDGEQIKVGTWDATLKAYVGCTRGWNGTTAAPHAPGAAVSGRFVGEAGDLRIEFAGSPEVRYENLTILDPADWTAPVPPGPATVEHADWDDFDPRMLEHFSKGSGLFRLMDSTPIFEDVSEPEHVNWTSDPHYSAARMTVQLRVEKVRPFDLATSPYFYPNIPDFGAETYAATLGSPLAAAAPGAVQVVSIPDGATAPVLVDSRLFAGGETMRVLEILGGGSYRVVRGEDGTEPVAHAAGPLQVGWRKAFPASIATPPAGRRLYELVLSEGSSPPRYGTTIPATALPQDAGLSPRRTLTLPNGVNASATTFAIQPAAPGDWDYIQRGLTIQVESERMTVASANRTAGTITVDARGGAGVAHAPGSAGTTWADKLLFRNADGTAREWKEMFHYSAVGVPTGPRTCLVVADGDCPHLDGEQPFDPAKAASPIETFPKSCYPYEMIGKFASMHPKAWAWINVPMTASDSLVRHIAKAVYTHLEPSPGRKVFVEYCNEVWNAGTFAFYRQFRSLWPLYGNAGDPYEYWILREARVAQIIREEFAKAGRSEEVHHILCWQTANIDGPLSICRRLGVQPDYASMAPYLDGPDTDDYARCVNANQDDELIADLFATMVEYGWSTNGFRSVNASNQAALAKHKSLTGVDLPVVFYEGGPEKPIPYRDDVADYNLRAKDIVRDPAWYFAERDVYSVFRKYGRIEGFALYSYIKDHGSLKPFIWGVGTHPYTRAGHGDGRDGGTDNRRFKLRQGVPGSKGPLDATETLDSVRLQAWQDATKSFLASLGADPGGETDPGENPPTQVVYARARRFLGRSRFRGR